MTYEEKFNIAEQLEKQGIEIFELIELHSAVLMGDQDKVNSDFFYLLKDIENIGITPKNLKQVINFLYKF
jgi:hypothetical protein